MKKFLHVGCGLLRKSQTIPYFNYPEWQEVRFDIDKNVSPDIVGAMTDMSAVASESMDAIFSSHNIEHLYAHEVVPALREFHRVLKLDGFVVIVCPDLKTLCKLVAEGKLMEPAYISTAGPISPHDVLFGHGDALARGNLYMAHNCGFTLELLFQRLGEAGFAEYAGHAHEPFALTVVARKQLSDVEQMRSFAQTVLGL
jgi:ubiquinone/menaquinone biosynthesis C-methylase UbiE